MTHRNQFGVFPNGGVHTVEFRVQRYRGREIIGIIEAVGCIRKESAIRSVGIFHRRVIVFLGPVGVHTIDKIDRGGNVDVIECREAGRDYRRMLETVAPVFGQVLLEELVLFAGYGVRQASVVVQ